MGNLGRYSLRSIAALFFVAMLFSCQDRLNLVRKMDTDNFGPQTEEKGVNLVYTDSGKVKVKLRSPKMLDYSNLDFPYREFPDGISLDFYDDEDQKNTVVSDYAIIYQETNLVDLQGNVKIVTGDSTVLKAHQLYWDRSRKWVFSDVDYTIKMTNGALNQGKGFDANENFNNFISRSNTGIQYIDESDQ